MSAFDPKRTFGPEGCCHGIEFRVGIHQGDVIIEGGDIFGDGVNVAARLEGIAEPGGICVSGRVQEDADGKLGLAFEDIGQQKLKNITKPVRVYRIAPSHPRSVGRGKKSGSRASIARHGTCGSILALPARRATALIQPSPLDGCAAIQEP